MRLATFWPNSKGICHLHILEHICKNQNANQRYAMLSCNARDMHFKPKWERKRESELWEMGLSKFRSIANSLSLSHAKMVWSHLSFGFEQVLGLGLMSFVCVCVCYAFELDEWMNCCYLGHYLPERKRGKGKEAIKFGTRTRAAFGSALVRNVSLVRQRTEANQKVAFQKVPKRFL